MNRRNYGGRSLLIVSPTAREVSQLTKFNLSLAVVGVGANAGKELRKTLVQSNMPQLVISVGFAASLNDSGDTGDLILCRDVIRDQDSSKRIAFEPSLVQQADQIFIAAGLSVRTGSLLCVGRPLMSAHEKTTKGNHTRALAADMEGYYIAASLHQLGVPHLAIRVILDRRNQNLPQFVEKIIDDPSGAEWRHALRSAWNPISVRSMLVLACQARTACAVIGKAADVFAQNYRPPDGIYQND